MEGLGKISRERLERLTGLLVDMCLHFAGAQYTESILRTRGFGDEDLAALGFEVEEMDLGDGDITFRGEMEYGDQDIQD